MAFIIQTTIMILYNSNRVKNNHKCLCGILHVALKTVREYAHQTIN
jgi:hypothetical protein